MKRFLTRAAMLFACTLAPIASGQTFVSDSLRAQCENCGKKTVELGKWDYCALSSVRQGGPNSACGMDWEPEGWSLVLYDAINDPQNRQPQDCRANCFSINKAPGNMTGNEVVEGATPAVSRPKPTQPPISSGSSLRASYQTTYGAWKPVSQGNNYYYGSYPEDSGRIFGTLNGHKFDGYWAEGSSSYRCNTEKDGSYYWGRFVMDFAPDFSSFTGLYSYCDSTPNRKWDGTAN